MEASTVIVGGGPAGAVAGRLLAAWGHRVVILEKDPGACPGDGPGRQRGLAESIPPSARKLLRQVGVLESIDAAGFFQSTGNTVWWESGDCRVESFGDSRGPGLQVFRPTLDRLLLQCAVESGVEVRAGARVRSVAFEGDAARVEYERGGRRERVSCEWVLDCSGRSGVLARRFRLAGHRTCALIGAWRIDGTSRADRGPRTSRGWRLPDPSHTVVEAYNRGWAWSVPLSAIERHVGLMVDRGPGSDHGRRLEHQGRRLRGAGAPGLRLRGAGAPGLRDVYCEELARTAHLRRHVQNAALDDVWACDASTYSSSQHSGRNFLLVGDAGAFVDPLSSFGVKKAIGSAWMAAVVVNTCLRHRDRRAAAIELFSRCEEDVNAMTAERSRAFARAALTRFPHPFWATRAEGDEPRPASAGKHRRAILEPGAPGPETPVHDALRRIQESDELDLRINDAVEYERHAVIRGREVVLEDAFPSGIRFRDNVDLVTLARLAGGCRQVPDLFEAYCRAQGPVPLPNVLGGLSLLVAKGFLVSAEPRGE